MMPSKLTIPPHLQIATKKQKFIQHVFSVVSYLILNNVCGVLPFVIILIIECAQLSYITGFIIEGENQNFNGLFYPVRILNYEKFLENEQSFGVWVCMYFIHLILLILLLILYVILDYLIEKKNITSGILFKFGSILTTLVLTILLIPMIEFLIVPFFCEKLQQIEGSSVICYGGFHGGLVICSIIGGFIYLIIVFFGCQLYLNSNLKKLLPWGGKNPKCFLIYTLRKLLIGIYSVIDSEMENAKTISIFLVIYLILEIVYKYMTHLTYSRFIHYFNCIKDGLELRFYFQVMILIGFPTTSPSSVAIIWTGVLVGVFLCSIEWRKIRKHLITGSGLCKSDFDYFLYLFSIMHYPKKIDPINSESYDASYYLYGLLALKTEKCIDDNCVCKDPKRFILKRIDFQSKAQNSKNNFTNTAQRQKKKLEIAIRSFQQIIEKMLDDLVLKNSKSFEFRILLSNFEMEIMNNYYKAYYHVVKAEQNNISLIEKFQVYLLKLVLNNEIISKEFNKHNVLISDFGLDSIIKFEKTIEKLENYIFLCSTQVLNFWLNLASPTMKVEKLYELANQIFRYFSQISEIFEGISKTYPSQVKAHLLYGYFLKHVMNNDFESQFITSKGMSIKNNLLASKLSLAMNESSFSVNSEIPVVMVSGNLKNLGEIFHANEFFIKFGYSRSDLIQNSVNMLVPPPLSFLHDNYMLRFYESGHVNVLGIQRLVFVQNKDGYLVPISILVRTMPGLQQGLNYIGCLNPDVAHIKNNLLKLPFEYQLRKKLSFILTDSNGQILGLCANAAKELGIPHKYFVKKKKLSNHSISIRVLNNDILDPEIDNVLPGGKELSLEVYPILDMLDQDFLKDGEKNQIKLYKKKTIKIKAFIMLIKLVFSDGLMVRVYLFTSLYHIHPLQQSQLYFDLNNKSGSTKIKDKNKNKYEDYLNEKEFYSASSSVASVELATTNSKIQEFKKKILERKSPQTIQKLQKGILILYSFLLIIGSIDYYFLTKNSTVHEYMSRLLSAYEQQKMQTSLTTSFIYSFLDIANNYQNNSNSFIQNRTLDLTLQIQDSLEELRIILDNAQFIRLNYNIDGMKKDDEIEFDCSYIYDDYTEYEETCNLNSMIRIYISNSLQLIDLNLNDLTSAPFQNNFKKAEGVSLTGIDRMIYFLLKNSEKSDLFLLLESMIDSIIDYATNHIKLEKIIFLSFFCVLVLGIIISSIIILPVIKLIQKNKSTILLLFAEMKLKKIIQLQIECNKFISDHLSFLKEEASYPDEEESDAQSFQNQPSIFSADLFLQEFSNLQKFINYDSKKRKTENDSKANEISISQAPLRKNTLLPPKLPRLNSIKKNKETENKNNQNQHINFQFEEPHINGYNEDEERKELIKKIKSEEEDYAEKKRNQLKKFKIGFGGITCIVCTIFITICLYLSCLFYFTFDKLNLVDTNFKESRIIHQSGSLLSHLLLHYKSFLHSKGQSSILINSEDILEYFITKNLESADHLKELQLQYYTPKNLEEVMYLIRSYNSEKYCDYINILVDDVGKLCCSNEINFGILNEGYSDSFTYYFKYIIQNHLNLKGKDASESIWSSQFGTTEIVEFELIFGHIYENSLKSMFTMVQTSFQNFLSDFFLQSSILYGFLLGLYILSLFLLWKFCIKKLENEIWKSKGILNLLPTDVLITKKFRQIIQRKNYIFGL